MIDLTQALATTLALDLAPIPTLHRLTLSQGLHVCMRAPTRGRSSCSQRA